MLRKKKRFDLCPSASSVRFIELCVARTEAGKEGGEEVREV